MTPFDETGPLLAGLIALLVWLLVLVGFYLWYAFALARLFPRLGGEAWNGWVPILNDMEVLVRGGVPGYSIVFAFIPVVNFYYIYLRIVAVHRIGTRLGHGAGMTVLGVLLPPLWATLVARSTTIAGAPLEQRVAGYAPSTSAVPLMAPGGGAAAPSGAAAPGGVVMPHPVGVVPPAPAAPHVATAQTAAAQPTTRQPAVTSAVSAAHEPNANPWAPRTQGQPEVASPTVVPAPVASAAPAVPPSIAPAPISTPPAAAPAPALGSTATAPAPLPAAVNDDDAFAETVVVQRRRRIRYRLEVEGGGSIPLTSDTVVLGRRPMTGEPGTQDIAVPDTTRTLSKVHARLQHTEEGWVITDLASTNGVVVVDDAENETLLDRGASALVRSRFILGTVALSLVEESARA